MTYSKDITLAHPLSESYKCAIEKLDDLLIREGLRRGLFTPNEVVLDLDRVETERAKKSHCRKENTVDFCMGICTIKEEERKNYSSMGTSTKKETKEITPQILLVEAKLKVVKTRNIEESELKGKLNHSKDLLGSEPPLSKEKVFLFKDRYVGEARRYISQMFSNSPNIKVLTTEEFKERYF